MSLFLKIDGLKGDATDLKHKGWFNVDRFDFGATSPASTSGKPTPKAALSFTVDINSLKGLAPLLTDLTTSKHFNSVELVDVNGAGQTVYDLKLTEAVLHTYSNMPGVKGGVETGLSFDVAKFNLKDQGAGKHFAGGGAGASPRYFLQVDGVTGDSTDAKHKGWFEVDRFDFGLTQAVDARGKPTGHAAASPLTVDIHSLTGLAALALDNANGRPIKSVRLVEVVQGARGDQTLYDLKLGDASLLKYSNMSGDNGKIETALSFDFKTQSLTAQGDGKQHFAAGGSSASLHYFLKVAGVNGGSTDAKHKGWFDVGRFDFGLTRSADVSGKGTGQVKFSPLTVDVNSLSGLNSLFHDIAATQSFSSVELVGVLEGAQGEQKVYDLKLSDAFLEKYSNGAGAGGGVDTALSFGFVKVDLKDQGAGASNFAAGGPPAGPHYFLKVEGVNGGSTDARHKGWFEVDGFDFGATRSASAGGKATGLAFSPLTVEINSLKGLTSLLDAAVNNKSIKTVELVEVDQAGQAVYDLKLSGASLLNYSNMPDAKGGLETNLSFDFKHVTLTDHGVTKDATATVSPNAFTDAATISDAVKQVAGSSKVHYFLKVEGLKGDSTDASHKDWFKVDGFDFAAMRSANASGKAAGGAFSPLTVDVNSLKGLASLLTDLTTNHVIGTVELVEVNGAGQTVYDLTLTKALLHGYENMPGANGGVETALSFDFQRVTLTDHGQAGKGTLGPAETSVADAGRSPAGAATTSATVTPVPDSGKVHYFLKVGELKGDATDLKHKDWFQVAGFDFKATGSTSADGKGTHKVEFSPLTADINSLRGLAPLLTDLTTSTLIKSVELVEVNEAGLTVYDLKLTNAILLMMQSAAGLHGVETSVAFDFKTATLIDHGVTKEGTLASPLSASFASHSVV
jgi:type VI protein secretion system component Hcp